MKSNTKTEILQKIESGEVEMKSKTHFALYSSFIASVIIITTLVTLFLVSFIAFIMHQNGALLLPSFGGVGITSLLLSIPWLLVIVVLLLVLTLEILVRRYSFVYKRPMVYSLLGLLVISVFAGGALAATPIHKYGEGLSTENRLPALGVVYKHYGPPKFKGGALVATIDEINETGLLITTASGNELFVATSTKTKFPLHEHLAPGDTILIIGKQIDDVFQAFGIRPFNEDQEVRFRHHFQKHHHMFEKMK